MTILGKLYISTVDNIIILKPQRMIVEAIEKEGIKYSHTAYVCQVISGLIDREHTTIDAAMFEQEFVAFCGFCQGICKGNHYISKSSEGY